MKVINLNDARLYVLVELNRKVLSRRVDDVKGLIVIVWSNQVKTRKAGMDVFDDLLLELRQVLLVIHFLLRVPNQDKVLWAIHQNDLVKVQGYVNLKILCGFVEVSEGLLPWGFLLDIEGIYLFEIPYFAGNFALVGRVIGRGKLNITDLLILHNILFLVCVNIEYVKNLLLILLKGVNNNLGLSYSQNKPLIDVKFNLSDER